MGYLIAIAIYLVALMVYGLVIAHRKVKTADDMVTGGHRIPFIILVGSLLATWCGGGGITGSAGVVYTGGPWVGAITFAAPPIGIILLYFIAGKVRKSNKVTVPEIMERPLRQGRQHHLRPVRHAGLCGRAGYAAQSGGRHSGAAVQLQRRYHVLWNGTDHLHRDHRNHYRGRWPGVCGLLRCRQRPDHDRRLLPGHSLPDERGSFSGCGAAAGEDHPDRRNVRLWNCWAISCPPWH